MIDAQPSVKQEDVKVEDAFLRQLAIDKRVHRLQQDLNKLRNERGGDPAELKLENEFLIKKQKDLEKENVRLEEQLKTASSGGTEMVTAQQSLVTSTKKNDDLVVEMDILKQRCSEEVTKREKAEVNLSNLRSEFEKLGNSWDELKDENSKLKTQVEDLAMALMDMQHSMCWICSRSHGRIGKGTEDVQIGTTRSGC